MSLRSSIHSLVLVGSVALVAMVVAHAITLGFGPPTPYHHVALGPAGLLAALLLVAGTVTALRRTTRRPSSRGREADWLLPAFASIRDAGAVQVIGIVVALELASLFASESYEQHVAGVAVSGIVALFGTASVAAPFVHVLLAIVAGIALWSASRAACEHADAIARFVRVALGLFVPRAAAPSPRIDRRATVVPSCVSAPLAFFVANRPPPQSIRLV
jgi:hypothetical protein